MRIKGIVDYSRDEIEETRKNCHFKAKRDFMGALHILDLGVESHYKSVFEILDWLIPFLREKFSLHRVSSVVFIYTTNGEVYRYIIHERKLILMEGSFVEANQQYLDEMGTLSRKAI